MKEILKKIGGAVVYPIQWLIWKIFYYSLIHPFVLVYRECKLRKRVEKLSSIGAVFSDNTN